MFVDEPSRYLGSESVPQSLCFLEKCSGFFLLSVFPRPVFGLKREPENAELNVSDHALFTSHRSCGAYDI